MSEKRHEVLCWNCRKKVTYTIKARKDIQNIKGIDYQYNERFAICNECKEEIMVPGLDDENVQELDNVYRKQNDLITIGEIELLLEKYMIQSCYEITNMSLQKLLYYFKAFGYIFFGKEVIQAEIAEIDYENLLSNEERMVCDYVLQCFGIYNGGVLRELTHCEMPWKLAREGLGDMQPCANVISNENIFVTIQ